MGMIYVFYNRRREGGLMLGYESFPNYLISVPTNLSINERNFGQWGLVNSEHDTDD